MSDTKQDWARMLRVMLQDFRLHNPQDKRSDKELLESLMEHFYQSGLVGKDADGNYLIGTIVDDISGDVC